MTLRGKLAGALVALLASACGDGAPLGGPHGGESVDIGPSGGWVAGRTYKEPDPPPPPAGGDPGTWFHLWSAYMAGSTPGDCTLCHSEMNTPRSSYDWLRELEYIGTEPVGLVDPAASCLAWFGGNMPPGLVPPNQALFDEFVVWANAGAQFN